MIQGWVMANVGHLEVASEADVTLLVTFLLVVEIAFVDEGVDLIKTMYMI
jgi:hypothetical protein